ncbi:MAG: lysophospholipid acyltransferase family protein [Rhizobacter sp.]
MLLRAAWRLAGAALHALHGALICAVVFPFLDDAGRARRIRGWSVRMLDRLGVRLHVAGGVHPGPVLLCANHVSWLDILVIDAIRPARFVAKADLRHWPLLGFMIAAAGTLFIERERKRDALRVVHHIAEAFRAGATVAVFPEGTTGEGRGLLPLHGNLLQAAIATETALQPVAIRYGDGGSPFSPAAAYVGATTLAQSAWRVACAEGLEAHVSLLPPLPTAATARRTLAAAAGARIQAALDLAANGASAIGAEATSGASESTDSLK